MQPWAALWAGLRAAPGSGAGRGRGLARGVGGVASAVQAERGANLQVLFVDVGADGVDDTGVEGALRTALAGGRAFQTPGACG